MGMFLNNISPKINYSKVKESPYFVDKSLFLEELLRISRVNPYICITRPRRFGKTVMANMAGAFFGKSAESKELFADLQIAGRKDSWKYMNQYQVICIDFSRLPDCCDSYESYIARIRDGLKEDLRQAYPQYVSDLERPVWDLLSDVFSATGERFVFILDEWDAIFHMSFVTEKAKEDYLLFLKSLLKDQAYVELAYMTGILPIAKYSDGSELNMFLEYHMAIKIPFSEYFGFSDEEVDMLYERYKKGTGQVRITREKLKEWYDGYHTAGGKKLYNPRSVVCALTDNQISDYWTSSGTYDSVFDYVKCNIQDVRDDLALMIAGESIPAEIQEYAASAMELHTKDEIYSAMVVYGLLTYEDGAVSIPNRELMNSFAGMMKKETSLGYIYRLANASAKMMKATLSDDTRAMEEILKFAHDTETPILSYHHETELSAVVNLVYLSARDRYRVEREDKAGRGFVDFIFYPQTPADDCLILELKVNHTPQEAIAQIKKKEYILRFLGKLGEKPKYRGRILAVGIGYDKETAEHRCEVEVLRERDGSL